MDYQKAKNSYDFVFEKMNGDTYFLGSWRYTDIKSEIINKSKNILKYLASQIGASKVKISENSGRLYSPELIAYIYINGIKKYMIEINTVQLFNKNGEYYSMVIIAREYEGRSFRKGYLLDTHYKDKSFEKVLDNLDFFVNEEYMSVSFNN